MSECVVAWCTSSAVTEEWVAWACPRQTTEAQAEIAASGLCPAHVQQAYGADITHRGKALVGPGFTPVDGTIDRR